MFARHITISYHKNKMDEPKKVDTKELTASMPPVRLRRPTLKSVLALVTVLLLIGGGMYGTYYWQHNELLAANRTINSLSKKITGLNSEVVSLKSENSKLLKDRAAPPTQSSLTISVSSSVRFNILGAINTPNSGVGVEVKFANPTQSPIYLDPNSIELQDGNGNVYKVATEVSNAPSGYVAVPSMSIAPNQTISGALFYMVNDLSLNHFNLINGSNTYSVTVE